MTKQIETVKEDMPNKLNKFNKALSIAPKVTKVNALANNSKYVPISEVESLLDKYFFGLWSTKDFNYQVIANEIVGSIVLEVVHPACGAVISRIGAGAVMIQQAKGADITNIAAKHKNTLSKDFPHLKAQCLKNAALSLGKVFGRDLNRDYEAGFQSFEVKKAKDQDLIS